MKMTYSVIQSLLHNYDKSVYDKLSGRLELRRGLEQIIFEFISEPNPKGCHKQIQDSVKCDDWFISIKTNMVS